MCLVVKIIIIWEWIPSFFISVAYFSLNIVIVASQIDITTFKIIALK